MMDAYETICRDSIWRVRGPDGLLFGNNPDDGYGAEFVSERHARDFAKAMSIAHRETESERVERAIAKLKQMAESFSKQQASALERGNQALASNFGSEAHALRLAIDILKGEGE
jgi:hypothetical protein